MCGNSAGVLPCVLSTWAYHLSVPSLHTLGSIPIDKIRTSHRLSILPPFHSSPLSFRYGAMIIVTGFVGKQLVWYVAQSNIKEIHEKQHKEGKTIYDVPSLTKFHYLLSFPQITFPHDSPLPSILSSFPPFLLFSFQHPKLLRKLTQMAVV